MAGITSISGIGAGIEAIRLQTEFQALAIRRQVDILNLQGDLAIQLIQSAVLTDPSVGQNLDVLA